MFFKCSVVGFTLSECLSCVCYRIECTSMVKFHADCSTFKVLFPMCVVDEIEFTSSEFSFRLCLSFHDKYYTKMVYI